MGAKTKKVAEPVGWGWESGMTVEEAIDWIGPTLEWKKKKKPPGRTGSRASSPTRPPASSPASASGKKRAASKPTWVKKGEAFVKRRVPVYVRRWFPQGLVKGDKVRCRNVKGAPEHYRGKTGTVIRGPRKSERAWFYKVPERDAWFALWKLDGQNGCLETRVCDLEPLGHEYIVGWARPAKSRGGATKR